MTFPPIPPTRRDDIVETLHGVTIPDPYRWLEDENDPEVRRWVDEQDAATRARLDALPRHADLKERIAKLLYVDVMSPYVKRGERRFVTRRRADLEKSVVSYTDGDDPQEHVLFDPNTWSDDGTTSLGVWVPSHSGRYVAYAVKANAADEATLRVRDLDTGSDLELDVIEGAKYANPSWMPADHGFYYTWLPTDPSIDVSERPGHAEVRYHALGTDPAEDARVHPATGSPRTFLHGEASHDGRWLVVTIVHGWNSTDVYLKDLTAGAGHAAPFTPFMVGHDAKYTVMPWRDRFYVYTDEGAPRGRVFEVEPDDADRASWREIVPESDDTALSTVQIVGDHLVLTGLRHATSRIEIRTLSGDLVREQPLPGLGTVEGFFGEPDDSEASFAFQSFVHPTQIWRTDVATGDSEKIAEVNVPLDVSDFVTEQVRYASKDGTEITMFLLRHRDTDANGDRPCVLYGYGGFNVSLTPAFRPELSVWLASGGIYAVPNLRGGGEYGEAWHRDGMLDKKQNVFDDYIAAAEHLIASGWTNPDRLAIRGGSNGGLLVGAAMTQRPDLFGAVICAVPLLDMIRYHLFGSGRTWIPEYGTAEDPEQFAFIEAYSPYRHVKEGVEYPALLMLASDSDDRVDPCHARKFVAAVQGASTGGPNWLRVERNAGHGGADKVGEQVSLAADWFAFAFDQLVDR